MERTIAGRSHSSSAAPARRLLRPTISHSCAALPPPRGRRPATRRTNPRSDPPNLSRRPPDMGRVVHFEIHAENPERAIAFYRELFGWEFTRWEGPMPYWLIRTGGAGEPGIDGGLMQRRGGGPTDGQ